MTIEDKIKEMLVEHGMWDDQAVAVMEMIKDGAHESMAYRWNANVEDYPQRLLRMLWASAKDTALEYIDANCPGMWYRPRFVADSSG